MSTSSIDPLDWIVDDLSILDETNLRRRLVARQSPPAATLRIDGQEYVNFASNDYLGLANDPRLKSAAVRAIELEGVGAGASPLIVGRSAMHAELEEKLAEFEGTEAALLFPSGYAANVGTIASLVGRGDAVFSDELNHASIVDGCRLSRAEVFVYPHCDVAALDDLLRSHDQHRRRLIVTDSLFSMHGDIAPLRELAEVASRHGCMLMVDEAHATGVFGPGGAGLVEALDLHEQVHVRVGTLSKALGCHGGFVCGSKALIDWLTNRARPYFFSTAPPPAIAAAALAALDIVRKEPPRRSALLQQAKTLRDALAADGWNIGAGHSQIIPIFVGDAREAVRLSSQLRSASVFAPAIRPPSVPEGQSCLRISLTSGHTAEIVASLANQLRSSSPLAS